MESQISTLLPKSLRPTPARGRKSKNWKRHIHSASSSHRAIKRQPLEPLGTLSFKEKNMAQRKSSGSRKYGKAAGKSVKSAMHRKKEGTLKSGRGGKGGTVKSREQAIAIGLSEARKKGAKVPRKRAA
jgi:hypothetical protein